MIGCWQPLLMAELAVSGSNRSILACSRRSTGKRGGIVIIKAERGGTKATKNGGGLRRPSERGNVFPVYPLIGQFLTVAVNTELDKKRDERKCGWSTNRSN